MAEEIGVAYLSVKPKMDGSFDSDVKSAGTSAGGGFGGAFQVAAGNLIANAVSSIASAAVDTFKNAFDNYANFEQLSGGVEKIFDQADIAGIMRDANNAYIDLNMSANEYLESINQTGAAFAQTMGDQKGYDTARTGMKAISDYASGTGRNLGELNEKFALITRATSSYQSIADQFSGILPATSADFLAQAQAAGFLSGEYKKLTDVPVAEYQEAVSKMLEKGVADMGLAGNTAMESTKTISGSLAMLSSSWQNFLTGIFDDNADMGALGQHLFESVGAVLSNVMPRIGLLVQRLVMGLPSAISSAMQAIPSMLEPAITAVFGEGVGGQVTAALSTAFSQVEDVFKRIADSVVPLFETVLATVQPVIETIVDLIVNVVLPAVTEAVDIIVGFITEDVIPTVNEVLETVRPVVERVTQLIQDNMPLIKEIVTKAMSLIRQVIETVWPVVKGIITTVVGAISQFMQTAWPIISGVVETAMRAISGAIDGVSYVVGVVQNIFNGVKRAIEDPIGAARDFIRNAIETIKGFFDFNISWPYIPLPHFNAWGSINPLDWLTEGPPGFSIDWYARGGMVEDATLIGAGERGAELIWPSYEPYLGKYADAIAERIGGKGGVDIHDCTFVVRQDSDIRRVAVELNTLINRQTAGGIA